MHRIENKLKGVSSWDVLDKKENTIMSSESTIIHGERRDGKHTLGRTGDGKFIVLNERNVIIRSTFILAHALAALSGFKYQPKPKSKLA